MYKKKLKLSKKPFFLIKTLIIDYFVAMPDTLQNHTETLSTKNLFLVYTKYIYMKPITTVFLSFLLPFCLSLTLSIFQVYVKRWSGKQRLSRHTDNND